MAIVIRMLPICTFFEMSSRGSRTAVNRDACLRATQSEKSLLVSWMTRQLKLLTITRGLR